MFQQFKWTIKANLFYSRLICFSNGLIMIVPWIAAFINEINLTWMFYLFSQKVSWNVLLNMLQFHTIKDLILNMCPDTFSSFVILNRGSQSYRMMQRQFCPLWKFSIFWSIQQKSIIELTVDKMESLSQKSCLLFLKHLILCIYGFWQ